MPLHAGLCATRDCGACSGMTREQHTTTAIDSAKSQTHSATTAGFGLFLPNGSALWRPHRLKSRPHRHQSGRIALHEGPTRRRHAARRLRVVQNPHHHRHGERQGHGEPGAVPVSGKSPTTGPKGGPAFGTKLSQHTHPHRMSGTKLSQHTSPHRISGIKLSLLTRNGPIWRFFCMQGEFCTAFTTKKPSRESYVPNARQSWG